MFLPVGFINQTSCHIAPLVAFAIPPSYGVDDRGGETRIQFVGQLRHRRSAAPPQKRMVQKIREERCYRLSRMSRATFPLGPNAFWGLPFNSALTPPAFPSVNMN